MAPQVAGRSHSQRGGGRILLCWQISERLFQKVLITFESQFLPNGILRTYFAETNICPLITEGADFSTKWLLFLPPTKKVLTESLQCTNYWLGHFLRIHSIHFYSSHMK